MKTASRKKKVRKPVTRRVPHFDSTQANNVCRFIRSAVCTLCPAGQSVAPAVCILVAFVVLFSTITLTTPTNANEPLVAANDPVNENVHFDAVSLYLDCGNVGLAAFQLEVTAKRGRIRIVGVEDGEVPVFAGDNLHFDRKTIEGGQSDRIILAAFSTAEQAKLPKGVQRIATLHIEVAGSEPAAYVAGLITAADANGARINPKITIE